MTSRTRVGFEYERLIKATELVEIAVEKNKTKLSASKNAKIVALFYQRLAAGDNMLHKEITERGSISA